MLKSSGAASISLIRQLKGYEKSVPPIKHQKCLPIGVFQRLRANTASDLATAMGQLAVGALFFGMRSCEYLQVAGDRKTKLLCVRDIRFFRGRQDIKKDRNQFYNRATSVSICFRLQKNDEKEAVITMHRAKLGGLCPVTTRGEIVSRVLSYEGLSLNSPVNLVKQTIKNKTKFVQVKSTQMLQHIRNTVTQIGADKLGFGPRDVGTHSIRSSFAMFLYVNNIKSDKIMLQGRWKSTAFLSYIRAQVMEFSTGLTDQMNRTKNFYSEPETSFNHREQHYLNVPHRHNTRTELLAV